MDTENKNKKENVWFLNVECLSILLQKVKQNIQTFEGLGSKYSWL